MSQLDVCVRCGTGATIGGGCCRADGDIDNKDIAGGSMEVSSFVRSGTFLLFVVGLLACGSGGGGSPQPNFTVSTSELFFGAPANGAQLSGQSVTGTVGDYSGPLYLYIVHTTNGIDIVYPPIVQGNSGTSTVVVKHPASVGRGAYFDDIVISACSDPACGNHLPGSPRTIPVTYVVGIAAVPSGLLFSSAAGTAPPSQTVKIYHWQRNTNWGSSYLYVSGNNWMTYNPSEGQTPTTVTVNVSAMPVGTPPGSAYTAEIRFGANAGTDLFSLPIIYTIN